MIEVSQVLPRQVAHGLGLQSLHKRAAQSEKEGPFLVRQLRLRDGGTFLRALQTQLPLALPFMQIASRDEWQRFGKRAVLVDGVFPERIDLVQGNGEIRVGTQVGGDLFVPRFVDADAGSAQSGIRLFKLRPRLLPRHCLRRGRLPEDGPGEAAGKQKPYRQPPEEALHVTSMTNWLGVFVQKEG